MIDFKMDTKRVYKGLYRGDMWEDFKESKVVLMASGRVSIRQV